VRPACTTRRPRRPRNPATTITFTKPTIWYEADAVPDRNSPVPAAAPRPGATHPPRAAAGLSCNEKGGAQPRPGAPMTGQTRTPATSPVTWDGIGGVVAIFRSYVLVAVHSL
jgi:hypothetical protein